MNKFDSSNSPMIFTLTDTTDTTPADDDWAQDLQNLRQKREAIGGVPPISAYDEEETIEIDIFDEPASLFSQSAHTLVKDVAQPSAVAETLLYRQPLADKPPRQFNDEELDRAYQLYLKQMAEEHNRRVAQQASVETDVGVLMQEDWLQAQSALKTEMARNRAQLLQTLLLNPEKNTVDLLSSDTDATPPRLPEFAVNVYALPDMPVTRRIKVLSEQELLNSLRDKLTPHLTNAVAGMVRQLLQKKLATLSYELQIQLNEETPQVVQEILEYNLDSALRTVKHQLREQ